MARLQFRVWNKDKKEMLYDNFIVRHGNDEWTQEQYDKYNKFYSDRITDWEPHRRHEITHDHAEPIETPDTIEKNDAITEIMEPGSLGGASWSLIDWSNFYFQEWITMQATGFHDKNNQLIWEGDLLKFGDLVHPVQWYYSNFIWNGQMIADFREFDIYGDEINPSAGYQGDVYGIQTENMEKVGNIFEDGEKYGFTREQIDGFKPSYPY